MNWLIRALKGEEKLWIVFWIYGIVVGIIFWIISFVANLLLGHIVGIVLFSIQLIYSVAILFAQWRCAFNTEWKIWGYIVRVLVILSLISQIIILISGGFIASSASKLTTTSTESSSSLSVTMGSQAVIECTKQTQQYAKNGGVDIKGYQQKCMQDKLHPNQASTDAAVPGVLVGKMPVPPATVTAPSTVTTPDVSQYKQACEQKMSDYAKKSGGDSQKYIAANQAYLQQCIDYYVHKTAVGKLQ